MLRIVSISILLLPLMAVAGVNETGLAKAISGSHRTEAYVQRDEYRRPLETLSFFDVQAQHTVMEVWPGGGWYTEILAPYLRISGQLIAAHYDSDDRQARYRPGSRKNFEEKMAANPDVFDQVRITSLKFDETSGVLAIGGAESGTVDRVVTFRNAHGWHATGTTDAAMAHFFDVLKPGGKLGIVQHRADAAQDWRSKNIGYVGRDHIVAAAAKAGFDLYAEGYFNRNPLDHKRYERGVWQLPPNIDGTETEEEKAPYRVIGESDRMTLLFVKPAR